jgi:hypothetical protein
MTDLIPYFAGFITLLFGVGFGFAIKDLNGKEDKRE